MPPPQEPSSGSSSSSSSSDPSVLQRLRAVLNDPDPKAKEDVTCGVCLDSVFEAEFVGRPDACAHLFCHGCVHTWFQKANSCPMCKAPAASLEKICPKTAKTLSRERVVQQAFKDWQSQGAEARAYQQQLLLTVCAICNHGHNDGVLLLCDTCDRGYHTYCLGLRRMYDFCFDF